MLPPDVESGLNAANRYLVHPLGPSLQLTVRRTVNVAFTGETFALWFECLMELAFAALEAILNRVHHDIIVVLGQLSLNELVLRSLHELASRAVETGNEVHMHAPLMIAMSHAKPVSEEHAGFDGGGGVDGPTRVCVRFTITGAGG